MDKRLLGWVTAAVIAPLAHASGIGWFSMVMGCLILIPISAFASRGWTGLGKNLSALELLWLVLILPTLMKGSAAYWPAQNDLAVPVTIVLLTLLSGSAEKGSRAGTILLCTIILLYVPVVLCGISDVNIKWMEPQWNGWDWNAVPVLLIPGLVGLWGTQANGRGRALAGIGIFAIVMAGITQGVLSLKICNLETAPLYTLAQTLHIGGISRFEAVVSMTMTLGYYALASFLVACGGKLGKTIGIPEFQGKLWVVGVTVLLLLMDLSLPQEMAAVGSVILWGIVPILMPKNKIEKSKKSA